jgi:hypothetical protein
MTIVLSIAVLSVLISTYLIRTFLIHKRKVSILNSTGTPAQGLLLEVRNLGLQQNSSSKLNEIAVKFPTRSGKEYVVKHQKLLEEGEIIAVGSTVDLTYLESDPSVCNVPSIGLVAQNKWTSLATGIFILVAGLFAAYVVFINIGTV